MRIDRICEYCHKDFIARKTISKTCSDRCAKMLYKQKQRQAKIESSNKETEAIRAKPIEELKAKEFLTVREVAKLLNSSRQMIYDLIKTGKVQAVNLKIKKTMISRASINLLFENKGLNQSEDNNTKED